LQGASASGADNFVRFAPVTGIGVHASFRMEATAVVVTAFPGSDCRVDVTALISSGLIGAGSAGAEGLAEFVVNGVSTSRAMGNCPTPQLIGPDSRVLCASLVLSQPCASITSLVVNVTGIHVINASTAPFRVQGTISLRLK